MAHSSVSYADEIRRLTIDPGARRLGEILDELQAQVDSLQARVDDCCDSSLANKGEGVATTGRAAKDNVSPPESNPGK